MDLHRNGRQQGGADEQKEARTQAHGKEFRPARAGVLASLGGLYRSVTDICVFH
jgi:hypothetical protein